MKRPLAWTAKEDEQLQKLLLDGTSTMEIAKLFHRSVAAVRGRANKLGLSVKLIKIQKH